ncbi:hypothetical protein ABT063_33450 [Streptomyces sp. NPDC002838]
MLLIHPVIAGEAARNCSLTTPPLKKLELVSAQPASSGVLIATHRPVP